MTSFQDFLNQSTFNDLCLNGDGPHFCDQGAGLKPILEPWAESLKSDAIRNWVLQSLASVGKTWDAKFPFVDFSLTSGHRVHVTFPPIAKSITVSIRKTPTPRGERIWPESPEYEILKGAVQRGESMILAGSTGSGKTTLLNQLISEIPNSERIIALEDTEELAPSHAHFIRLLSRPANADGFGEVTLRMLLKQTLRMRPDRVLLGECRGEEVLDLLQALNTGHRGTLATLHANSAREVLQRIELLCLLSGGGKIPLSALRQLLANGIQWIVQLKKINETRKISEIWHIEGREGDTILMRPVVQIERDATPEPRIQRLEHPRNLATAIGRS